MRNDFKIFALVIAALVIICILIGIYATYWPSISSHVGDNNAGISTKITWENQTDPYYGWPIYADNGTVKGHIPIQAYYPTLVMAIMDDKVIPFYYNGSLSKTHLIDPGENAGIWMPNDSEFEITGISEGVHDLVIIAFVDPYNFNQSWWLRNGPIVTSEQNYVIISASGNDRMQELKYQSFSYAIVTSTTSSSNTSFICETASSNPIGQLVKLRKGTVLNYTVNIGHIYVNDNTTDLPFKVVQLLDYEQVPVQYNSTDYVYTGRTTNSEPVAVPLSIKAPDISGYHKLIIIISINPHQALDPGHGGAQWETQMGTDDVDIKVF